MLTSGISLAPTASGPARDIAAEISIRSRRPVRVIRLITLASFVATTQLATASDNASPVSSTGENDGVALTIDTRAVNNAKELERLFDSVAAATTSFSDTSAAKEWLQDMSNRIEFKLKDPIYRLELLKSVHEHARAVGLDPQIVLSVIEIESTFNRFAISKSGARGLMQIMPFWIKEIGHPRDNLFNLETNLWYGCYILRHYIDKSEGNLGLALRRYNGGGDDRYANKVLSALQNRWLLEN